MELGWEEKRIQALFSELRVADEQIAPQFAGVWDRAQLAPQRMRTFNPAFVAAAGLLVCALVSLGVWSRYSQQTQPPLAVVATPPAVVNSGPTTVADNSGGELTAKVKPVEPSLKSRDNSLAARRRAQLIAANRKLTREAKAITSWQSPTAALLSSPNDEIFTSLPQLNQSASDLKSFLPSRSN